MCDGRTTGGGRRTAGYRIKNKNPTQRCGEKPWKMKQRKPKVKVNTYMELSTQDRCIHPANGGTLSWHTPLSRPFNRGRLCKNEGRAMQNCGKHTGGLKKKHIKRHKPRVKVKTYMEFSNTRQVHTSCKWGVCHTKMAHHAFNRCGG